MLYVLLEGIAYLLIAFAFGAFLELKFRACAVLFFASSILLLVIGNHGASVVAFAISLVMLVLHGMKKRMEREGTH